MSVPRPGKGCLGKSSCIVIAVMLMVIVPAVTFIALGGYWESWPIFDEYSGPMRFRQLAADPVPPAVYDLRGGHSGFPAGQIKTRFRFKGTVEELAFLDRWIGMIEIEKTAAYAAFAGKMSISHIYRRDIEDGEAFLIFDEEAQEGVLYVP